MREDKARLERAAMLMFQRALGLQFQRELHIHEQRERPDFLVQDRSGRYIGIEVTHLYQSEEEARFLNGHPTSNIHPITNVDELLDALNNNLRNKAALSYGYEAPDGLLILLIRVTSPNVQKSTLLAHFDRIVVPPSAYDEIWMLFYDFNHLDWADLLRLDGAHSIEE